MRRSRSFPHPPSPSSALSSNEASFRATLAKLRSQTHRQRHSQRHNDARFAWLKENRRLQRLSHSLSHSLSSLPSSLPSPPAAPPLALAPHVSAHLDRTRSLVKQFTTGKPRPPRADVEQAIARTKAMLHVALHQLDADQAELERDLSKLRQAATERPTSASHAPDLEARAAAQLQQLNDDFAEFNIELDAKYAKRIPNSQPWTKRETALFRKTYRECARQRLPRPKLLERLCFVFPERSRPEVSKHLEWFRKKVAVQRQRRDISAALERDLLALAAEQREQQLQEQRAAEQEHERAMDELVQALHAARRQEKLTALRVKRAASARERAEQEAAAQAKQAKQEAAAQRAQEYERKIKHQLLEQYRRRKQELLDEQQRTLEALEREREAEKEAKRSYNQTRIQHRRKLLHEKQVAAQHRREELEREAAQQRERLDKLKAQVAVHVESDPDRLLQATQASANAAAAARERELFPVHGYNMDELLKDQRFRLQMALAERGLANTEYGSRLVAAAAPARAPRPDAKSQLKL